MSEPKLLHTLVPTQILFRYLKAQGVSPEACLQGSAIQTPDLGQSGRLIEPQEELAILSKAAQLLATRAGAGFELGLCFRLSHFGAFGFALTSSRNLKEAAEFAVRHLPVAAVWCRLQSYTESDDFVMELQPVAVEALLQAFLLDRDVAIILSSLSEVLLEPVIVPRLEFKAPEPADCYHQRLSGIQPLYGQKRDAIVISRQQSSADSPTNDHRFRQWLDLQCRALADARKLDGLDGQVRRELLGIDCLSLTIEQVAARLSMSPRSLRRGLQQEGTHFRAIQDGLRKDLAHEALLAGNAKLEPLALQLGYKDLASFIRAFRRWYGTTPGQYRGKIHASV